MGEVVSFSRAKQTDIFSMFDSVCPPLPDQADREVTETAARAVGAEVSNSVSFRAAFLLVGAVSMIGILLVHGLLRTDGENQLTHPLFASGEALLPAGVTNSAGGALSRETIISGDTAFSSQIVVTDEFLAVEMKPGPDDPPWRRSREAWLEHIATLESDPSYQQLLREKQLLSLIYPD